MQAARLPAGRYASQPATSPHIARPGGRASKSVLGWPTTTYQLSQSEAFVLYRQWSRVRASAWKETDIGHQVRPFAVLCRWPASRAESDTSGLLPSYMQNNDFGRSKFTLLTNFRNFVQFWQNSKTLNAMRERKILSDFKISFFPELVLTRSNFPALFQFDSETFWLFAPVYCIPV